MHLATLIHNQKESNKLSLCKQIIPTSSLALCYGPIPSYKTNDPDLWNCRTEWVHSTTLLRPLFTNFPLTSPHGIESEGVGARSVRSQLRLYNAQPARENMRKMTPEENRRISLK